MISTIGILGSGTMGSGIAQVAALSGFNVLLYDVSADALQRAVERIKDDLGRSIEKDRLTQQQADSAIGNIHVHSTLNPLHRSDAIIEAAVEDLGVKRELFKRLDDVLPSHAILATNTSSLSVTSIAAATKRAPSVVGMHFFNPPPLMKLVEIVRGKQTSDETVHLVCDLAQKLGKVPVQCKDTPGFIVNRVARPFYGESLRLLGEGVASVEEIDRIVRLSGGFKMGPFELMDLIGIDVNYAVTKSVYEQYFHEPRFRPHPIQRQMVEAGTLGRKTKRGFYSYE
ncbi:MAG TPA: 3-hydroxybutyryl-CoA dehydrogenase [Bacteroidetes bacterium]|jgi:3-hydroxybutyryl-CoA dehydrogenase|nr:3-hydroxybutyryl-CoA dehydrogenase [Bacteroidota bacterium]